MVKLGVTKKSVDPTKEPSGKQSAARCDKARALLIGGGDSIQVTKVPVARTLRRLNQHQLEVFNAIVSSGSITAAARLLHISQPAVSRSLSNLEREIGFALFKRDKKRVAITPEGTSFYEEVRRSYLGLDRLEQAAQEIRELRRAHLRIASLPALSYGMVPSAIKIFLDRNPSMKITFEARMSSHVVESRECRKPTGRYRDCASGVGISRTEDSFLIPRGLRLRDADRSSILRQGGYSDS